MDTSSTEQPPGGSRTRTARGDARSVPALARLLGVSVPRVHRLLDAEGAPPAGGRGRRRSVTPRLVDRLVRRVGAVPVVLPGFDRVGMLVLAAVARAPL